MKRNAFTIAVTSGKGGVGKSVVAVNLAEALAAEGAVVALVDVDFGQSACSVLLNETPAATVYDTVRATAVAAQVRHRTASGLTLVQAVAEAGQAERSPRALYAALDHLLGDLRRSHDFILLDTPAGVDAPVRWALDRADLGLLTLVGEPTAIADAYQLAKLVWQADPARPLASVVNFAENEAEAQSVADRFGQVTRHFLQQAPPFYGWVPYAPEVRRSVQAQTPVVRRPGPVRDAFFEIARRLQTERITLHRHELAA